MKHVEKKTVCPFCYSKHELASNITGDGGPDDGDVTLCFRCGEFAMFDSSVAGGLRKPTPDEHEELADDPDCRDAREAWAAVKKTKEGIQ